MKKRRLLKLADLLEADARNRRGIKFNLGVVACAPALSAEKRLKVDCGTQACAMGLAAISGAFARQGLGYEVIAGISGYDISPTINGNEMDYDEAAMELFDITSRQANFLFSPQGYGVECPRGATGERFVAKRIRNFVAGKETA